jgi:hypothetical protein
MNEELKQTMINHISAIRQTINTLYRQSHTGIIRLDHPDTKRGYESLEALDRIVREYPIGKE